MTDTLDSAIVAQYLADHPHFFEEHANLLGDVKLSSPLTGRAVSLQERQMEVMRDKYKALELRLSELTRHAQENSTIANRFHSWNQSILQVRDAAAVPRAVAQGLVDSFHVPAATLRLFNVAPEHADAWFASGVSEDARLFANSLLAPYCGSNNDFEAVRWLDDAASIKSAVILPLRKPGAKGAAFGLLIMGSPDPERFTSLMATDFLVHIGETASVALAPCWPDPMDGAGKLEQAAAYLAHLATQRKLSAHTVAAYGRDLRELATLSEGKAWDALSHFDIRRYAAQLHSRGQDARSIARKLSGWRGFFAWLGQHSALPANPVEGVRAPKRTRALPKALSVDAAVQLVAPSAPSAGADEPARLCNRAMFELLYSSGLRVSELAGLDCTYCKAADGQPASAGWLERENGEVVVTGKGGKMRRVPVGSAALDALQAWLAVRPAPADGSHALFLNERARRISPRVVQLRLKAHGIQSGVPVAVHPHMLRHSFASHVLQSSGDLRAVQEMLGHASITSTQVYTALDFQHLALVYDKAHPRAKLK